jgi:hypothetical protein
MKLSEQICAHHRRRLSASDGGGPAVDPKLAERPVRVAEKEAAHDGFPDAVPPTPHVQMLGPKEVHDASARGSPRVADGVHRRHLAVRESMAPKQIVGPVSRRRH